MSDKMDTDYDQFRTGSNRTARKKAMLAALLKQITERDSPVVDTGLFKVANWAAPLSKIVEGFQARSLDKEIGEEEAATSAAYNKRRKDETAKYFDTVSGRPELNAVANDDEGYPLPPTGRKPDMMKAIFDAMQGGDPTAMKLAEGDMKQISEGRIQPKHVMSNINHVNPASDYVQNLIPGVEGMPKLGVEAGVATALTPTAGGGVNMAALPVQTWSEPSPATEDRPSYSISSLTNKPEVTSPQLKNPETSLRLGSDKLVIDTIDKGYQRSISAVPVRQAVRSTYNIVKDIPDNALGPAADWRNTFGALARQMNIPKELADFSDVPDVQAARGLLWTLVKQNTKAVAPVAGPDLMEVDRRQGNIKNDKQALLFMLKWSDHEISQGIKEHNRLTKAGAKRKGGEGLADFLVEDDDDSPSSASLMTAPSKIPDVVPSMPPNVTPSVRPSAAHAPGAVKITSDAEFDALPSGTSFIGPDGKLRRKP